MASKFALLLLLFGCSCVCAQGQGDFLIDFACENCRPADALLQLSRQTRVNILFNDRFFQQCPPVSVSAAQQRFTAVLEQISACGKVGYKYADNQVVFFRKIQKHTLSGYIQDAETGERLIGAGIKAPVVQNAGAISNEFGFFSLKLDEGDYMLTASHTGHRPERFKVALTTDRLLNIRLQNDGALAEVVVSAKQSGESSPKNKEGRTTLLPDDFENLPMPGGEPDLLRSVSLQTGVQTGVDGLGGLHIRGGNADQNLILLDDVPVYNPSHTLGLFSIFNTTTVNNARLWKGDFPARYGGRISSVLDIRTREGNFKEMKANASVGLFAGTLGVEGPVIRDKSSFLFGVRGTYFGPWVRLLSKEDNLLNNPKVRGNLLNPSGKGTDYRFHDINLKFNYALSGRDRFYFNYYLGGDDFANRFTNRNLTQQGIFIDNYTLSSNWGNTIASMRWNHLLSHNLFTNTTFRFSRFFYQSQLGVNSRYISNTRTSTLADYAQLYQTLIRDLSAKTDFTWYPVERMTLRWGLSYTLHDFQPGALAVNFLQPGVGALDSIANALQNSARIDARETEAYLDAELNPWRNVRFEVGVNANTFKVGDTRYNILLPRLKTIIGPERGWSGWAGYHATAQNLHQIGSFNISLPFELWVPSTARVKPERAWQLSSGMGLQTERWAWSVEAYYKRLERVLAFLSSNDALYNGGAEDASGWEDRVAAGEGWSKGIETSFEWLKGRTTGNLAYTLSQSVRQFPDINQGRPFAFRFDRRHDLKLTVRQNLTTWLNFDAIWAYATGNPITLAGVRYKHAADDPRLSRDIFVYTDVNDFRLPHYHRLDLAFNANYSVGKTKHAVQLGVYNLYNRANPFFIFVNAGNDQPGKATQYTLLPALPVFRYEVKW
jgi:TonB dependent receptor/CarboxypepD_reg-like domain/TonB-dependent Receptor Plug Domain